MEELVILNHSDSSVHFYKFDKDADLDYDFIEKFLILTTIRTDQLNNKLNIEFSLKNFLKIK